MAVNLYDFGTPLMAIPSGLSQQADISMKQQAVQNAELQNQQQQMQNKHQQMQIDSVQRQQFREQAFQNDMQLLGQEKVKDPKYFNNLAIKYPEFARQLQDSYTMYEEPTKKALTGIDVKAYYMLNGGASPEQISSFYENNALQFEKSGDTKTAESIREMGNVARENPTMAQNMIMGNLAINNKGIADTMFKTGRSEMTAEEKNFNTLRGLKGGERDAFGNLIGVNKFEQNMYLQDKKAQDAQVLIQMKSELSSNLEEQKNQGKMSLEEFKAKQAQINNMTNNQAKMAVAELGYRGRTESAEKKVQGQKELQLNADVSKFQDKELKFNNYLTDFENFKQDTLLGINKIKPLIENTNDWNTGYGAALNNAFANPDYRARQAKIDSIKSQLGLDGLKNLSAIGESLGIVSDKDFQALQNSVANLDSSQSAEGFKEQLNNIIEYRTNLIKKMAPKIQNQFSALNKSRVSLINRGYVFGETQAQQQMPQEQPVQVIQPQQRQGYSIKAVRPSQGQ